MPSGHVDTVIWLGAGASYGSQNGKIEDPPPVTPSFLSDSAVRQMMTRYPVLHELWRVFGEPSNLESFWHRLDDECNAAAPMASCDIVDLRRRLRESVDLPDADDARRGYYREYLQASPPVSSIATYLNLVYVAGWDLKHLLICVLNRADYDLALYQRLFDEVRSDFGVLTFNYDTIAEQALKRMGRPIQYADAVEGAIRVLKPHGSIQWEWRKNADGSHDFDLVRTLRAESPFGILTNEGFFRDSLMIGLRTKRELTGADPSDAVNRFWAHRLSDARQMLAGARRVIVIGFAFQDADTYLWQRLSADQIGRDKRVLVCNRKSDEADREEMTNKVKEFFATIDVTAHWDGFESRFIDVLHDWKDKA